MTAKQLREARQKLGLSQKEIAEALETPFRTYQNWELEGPEGRRVPGIVAVAIRCIGQKHKGKRKGD